MSALFGTGAKAGIDAIHGQSPYGVLSLNTMVRSSGVSIEESSLPW